MAWRTAAEILILQLFPFGNNDVNNHINNHISNGDKHTNDYLNFDNQVGKNLNVAKLT